MRVTKIKIKNLFGITETELDGRSVELTGTNGVGKTSVIDSIIYALTNSSEREYIIKQGENEGEIIIETDTGVNLRRKKRNGMSDYKSVKESGREIPSPERFLTQLFTPLQLDPIAFCSLPKAEQNRIILDLIDFEWDLNWIREQFGEIPSNVNYDQNILRVLYEIQAEDGDYFQRRQDINRDARNKRAFIEDIAQDIPVGYDAKKWNAADIGALYKKLNTIKEENNRIHRAKTFQSDYNNKKRGLQADAEIAKAAAEREAMNEKNTLSKTIERLKAEIKACEDKLSTVDSKLADKYAVIDSKYETSITKLDADFGVAAQYADKEPVDCTELEKEISITEEMKQHLNEFKRMESMMNELDELHTAAEDLTQKIELARTLPGKILQTAKLPIENFSVKDGIPLVNDLPVSNLSDGEKLKLCVDVALARPNALQIILIDGIEKLSESNREQLYQHCRDKGLQFIATRTTESEEMEVRYL